jgi:Family of unknown function (DUF5675)
VRIQYRPIRGIFKGGALSKIAGFDHYLSMDLILKRLEFREDGIFGELLSGTGEFICITLEHAYPVEGSDPQPKVPEGVYKCQRGTHQLHPDKPKFETFQITNVPGHWGVLFHQGNYNKDSEGCVLLGTGLGWTAQKQKMITGSKIAFDKFMKLFAGVDDFTLEVKS